uniref:Uncharacterized protein n=1 Tax=viral metagenome TaxID=1070528 RepID=A0A6C0CK31_9ZZZZ
MITIKGVTFYDHGVDKIPKTARRPRCINRISIEGAGIQVGFGEYVDSRYYYFTIDPEREIELFINEICVGNKHYQKLSHYVKYLGGNLVSVYQDTDPFYIACDIYRADIIQNE